MRRRIVRGLLVLIALSNLFSSDSYAQTREKGPWWPHPIWGPEDEAGASNLITPDRIVAGLRLVTDGKVYELGHPYEPGMSHILGRRVYRMELSGPHGPVADNQLIWFDEFLSADIGQVGTQFDAPGHVGMRMSMSDGTVKDVFYNGFTAEEMWAPDGLRHLGVEKMKPYITRGVLVDVAGYKGLDTLPASYEITLADVKESLKRQGMQEGDITAGDAIFLRTGWSAYWDDPEKYENLVPGVGYRLPGIGLEVARWLVGRNVSLVGDDGPGVDVFPASSPGVSHPVHQELVMKNGIPLLEAMTLDELSEDGTYEFLFIFTPIRFTGAGGSPGRPIAIR